MPDIAVVDYGMGNLRSVAKALHHVAPPRGIELGRAAGLVQPLDDALPHLGCRSSRERNKRLWTADICGRPVAFWVYDKSLFTGAVQAAS